MPKNPERPSQSDYRSALTKITDHSWNIIKAFTDSETPIQPEFITPGEAALFLTPATYILPRSWIPGWVRQWAGQDGEEAFVAEARKSMTASAS